MAEETANVPEEAEGHEALGKRAEKPSATPSAATSPWPCSPSGRGSTSAAGRCTSAWAPSCDGRSSRASGPTTGRRTDHGGAAAAAGAGSSIDGRCPTARWTQPTRRSGALTPGWVKKLAFEVLVLTATRLAEVGVARWGGVDLAARVWAIPASRLKAEREHRVPPGGRAAEPRARRQGGGLPRREPSCYSPARSRSMVCRLGCTRRPCRRSSRLALMAVNTSSSDDSAGSPRYAAIQRSTSDQRQSR